jgi:hypothetical protein
MTEESSRALHCFPVPADFDAPARASCWVEDDGITEAWRNGGYMLASLVLAGDAARVTLEARRMRGDFAPATGPVRVMLPAGASRVLELGEHGLGVRLVHG